MRITLPENKTIHSKSSAVKQMSMKFCLVDFPFPSLLAARHGYCSRTIMMWLILILPLQICISCGQNTDSKDTTNNFSVQSAEFNPEKPVRNALTFLNSYVDSCNKMKNSTGIVEWVKSSKLTTDNFRNELERILDEACKRDPETGLDSDPIFDAQDYPDNGFELDSFDSKTNYIVVKGKNCPDYKLTIKMVPENNSWFVDGCGIVNIPVEKRIPR